MMDDETNNDIPAINGPAILVVVGASIMLVVLVAVIGNFIQSLWL